MPGGYTGETQLPQHRALHPAPRSLHLILTSAPHAPLSNGPASLALSRPHLASPRGSFQGTCPRNQAEALAIGSRVNAPPEQLPGARQTAPGWIAGTWGTDAASRKAAPPEELSKGLRAAGRGSGSQKRSPGRAAPLGPRPPWHGCSTVPARCQRGRRQSSPSTWRIN